MDLEEQRRLKQVAEEHAGEPLVVVLGSPNPESAELYARTVTDGDPTYAGPLAGIPLGIPVYHVFDPEIKGAVEPGLYDQQVGVMEMALDAEEIVTAVRRVRES